MKYALIDTTPKPGTVAKLCDLLDVAHLEELRMVAVIKSAHLRGRGIYSAKKTQSEPDLMST